MPEIMLKVLVLGCGTMGSQAAAVFDKAGLSVHLLVKDEQKALKKINRAKKILQHSRFSANIQTFDSVDDYDFRDVDVIFECLSEELTLKQEVVSKVLVSDDTSLCSNSSSYLPSEIHPTAHGLHFLNPINIPYVETTLCESASEISQSRYLMLLSALSAIGYKSIPTMTLRRGYYVNRYIFAIIADYLSLRDYPEKQEAFLEMLKATGFDLKPEKLIKVVGVDLTNTIIENIFSGNEKNG